MERDPTIWRRAREALPLPMLLVKMGDAAYGKKNSECPFCGGNKKTWGIFRDETAAGFSFKCHALNCPANQPEHGHNEIGYIILRRGLPVNEAAQLFLSLALPEEYQPPQDPRPGRPEPEPERDFSLRDGPARNIWHNLWKRLVLTAADREKISLKRGLSDEVIDTLGFRSNNATNLAILQAMAADLGIDQMVKEGLYIDDRRSLRPCGQFIGYGISGKKKEDGSSVYELNEPIIIPYLSEEAIPFYLRPHKGGVAKPGADMEDERLILEAGGEDVPCSSHVYCPFTISDLIANFDGRCILTEGEWKVAALYQCGIPAIAVPGITFIRNPTFKKQLLGILTDLGVTEVIVIFDNEVKDDPNFPSRYKPDPSKRYETQVWAEYTAIDLRKSSNISVKIGWLPDEVRVDGKADFDGVLAGFIHAVPGHKYFNSPLGLKEGTRRARQLFRELIGSATEKTSQQDLFPSEVRRNIESRLSQLFYKPKLATGGDRETRLAKRFAEPSDHTGLPIDPELAEKLRDVRGCYFVRKAVEKDERSKLQEELKSLDAALGRHEDGSEPLTAKHLNHIYVRKAAIYEWLKGAPEAISDFILECRYKLHAGEIVNRLVTIRSRNDNTRSDKLVRLSPKSLARLGDFREWSYSTGKGVWNGGDKDLQFMVMDLDMRSHLRDIHEVNLYGYHEDSKIWFFGDSAFVTVKDPEGEGVTVKRIEADKTNVFWHEGIGYQVDASVDERGSSFAQGAPLMLTDQGTPTKAVAPPVEQIFTQACEDFYNTIGGYTGWAALGIMLAYGVAPELLKQGGHPGLWLSGKMSGGKSYIARWLERIWGFKELTGLSLGESTPVAINRILAQYSCLPAWFDEFRKDEVDKTKVYVLRHSYDRGGAGKGLPDYSVRTRMAGAKTTPLVSGETGSNDAATRSRYVQIQISIHSRIGDGAARFPRLNESARWYYLLGRAVMEKRPQFLAKFQDYLMDWMDHPEVKADVPNERARFVHGVAFAAIYAMDDLLQSKLQGMNGFMTALRQHAKDSLKDSMDETFINTFWRDVIGGLQTKRIKGYAFVIAYVSAQPNGALKEAHDDDHNGQWVLYVATQQVFNEYALDKRTRNEPVNIDQPGLIRELCKEPYWCPLPKNSDRNHRKTIDGTKRSCMVISLERKNPDDPSSPHLFPYVTDLIPLIASDDTMQALVRRGILTEDDRTLN